MKIAIVGQGAIASLFCYYWQAENPLILTRGGTGKPISLRLLNDELVHLSCQLDSIQAPSQKALDYLFICVKSYHIEALIEDIKPWLSTKTTLILVQNGMGGADLLHAAFEDNELLVGTTTDAVYRSHQNEFVVTANGRLDIGLYNTLESSEFKSLSGEHLAILNRHPQLNVQVNIHIALLQKLAVNAIINPLTAILNIKNGELRHYPQKVADLITDINLIYQAMLCHTPLQNTPELQAPQLSVLVENVIENTANNYSSMHQDIQYHRQTEIESVLGYLRTQANKYPLSIPSIDKMYEEVLRKSQRKSE